MKPIVAGLFLLSGFLGATALSQTPTTPALRSGMLVSTGWLAKNLSGPKLLVLHVGQGRKQYDAAHIPGARFLEYNEIVVTRDGIINELPPVQKLQQVFSQIGIDEDVRVVLMCDMQGLLAARVYWTLDYLGYGDKAALLDGGLEKWKLEKRELSVDSPQTGAGRFTPRLNPKVLVTREVVRDISWLRVNDKSAEPVLLDAREPDAYSGELKGRTLTVAGHIQGAVNVYWMHTLNGKESPTFKPAAELRKMYADAGAVSGKKVVVYCWIGMMASHAYFMLKYLGYDVAMYDGSFTEWVKSEGAPVVQGK
jgi:thiosulfate/3-mercaptopyruvate sulfurtransferase